jgi:cytochrome P450
MLHSFPSPQGAGLFGHVQQLGPNSFEFLQHCRAHYGDVVHLRVLNRHSYLINRPEWIQDVMVNHVDKFEKGRLLKQIGKNMLGEGLLTSERVHHKKQRKLIQPAFHHGRAAAYSAAMVAQTERMMANWQHGSTVDIDHAMMLLTQSIVAKTLFDADVSTQAEEIGSVIAQQLRLISENLTRTLFFNWLPSRHKRERLEGMKKLDALIYSFIAEWRRQGGQDKGDLLSMLLLSTDEDGTPMSDRQARDEALTLFIAGHETTANALAWTWYLLVQHPQAMATLHAELESILGERTLTADDLRRLPYTEKVIKEAIRLYPPAWMITRRSIAPVEVGGYHFPADTLFLMSPYLMHRDGRYFPDPLSFQPERWTAEFEKELPRYAYFPFGGGPRICIGNGFAMMEAQLILATMAQRLDLSLLNDAPVQPEPLITLRPRTPIQMRVSLRQQKLQAQSDQPVLSPSSS